MTDKEFERFCIYVDVPDGDACWEWTGGKFTQGYGSFRMGRNRRAHIVSYEHFVRPVPKGKVLDHLCRNRACVNPAHLEPVTRRENTLRGNAMITKSRNSGFCANGHSTSGPGELYTNPGGKTECVQCRRDQQARFRERHGKRV